MFARVVALFFITKNYSSRSNSEDALGFNWNLTLRFRKIPLNQLREEWKSEGRWFALLALRDPSSNPIKTIRFQMVHLMYRKAHSQRPHVEPKGVNFPGLQGEGFKSRNYIQVSDVLFKASVKKSVISHIKSWEGGTSTQWRGVRPPVKHVSRVVASS
ncbi:hypothetical protein AVEN_18528-1 [Araneus ventricosus]|uniref:Uncharacterized protein n=1 Tax=Araneus ventricosus TaxID=182803 RepID=A0A4Y2WFM8_ARAVE|nr:hypothetical protein AVEN_18528-1 [Araneus ventricosus]